MRTDLLVVNAGHLATMQGPSGPQRGKRFGSVGLRSDGAVAVRDGRIVDVGRTSTMRRRHTATRIADAEGGLVTPGFVDAHTHLPFGGDRAFELRLKLQGKSYLDILRAGGGIRHTVAATRAASLKRLISAVRERAATMLAWGTTTAEAKSGYGLEWKTERKQLLALRGAQDPRLPRLVPTFLGAHVVPEERARDRGAWVRELADTMVPRVAREGLADFVDVFLDDGAYTRAEATTILTAAQRAGLATKLHADEFVNHQGAELATQLGATSCEHLLRVSAKGIRALGASKTVAVLLPGVVELGFMERQAPARRLIEADAAVALGTDFNPNCPVATMPTILQWAVHKLRLTPEEALAAATTNAAHAVGLGREVGRIATGFQADLLVHHHANVEDLAYWVGPNPVRMVIRGGRVVSRDA